MMKKVATISMLLLLLGGVFAQTTVSLQAITQPTSRAALDQHFKAYTLVEVDYQNLYQQHLQTDGVIQFQLEGFGSKVLNFTISPWELRSENYFQQRWDGQKVNRFAASRTATYRGNLSQQTVDEAYFTIDRQFLMGHFTVEEEEYFLEPLWRMDPAADREHYVLYRAVDAIMPADFCGLASSNASDKGAKETVDKPASGPEKLGDCYIVDIALASDFELYQDFGNDETSTENFMLNNLMNVQTNYDNEFADEIQFEVATTFIATCNTIACDPWTNNPAAGVLLDDFVDWGNGGGFGGVSYDVASLWTGRNFTGTTIGVAYLNAVCTSLRYNTCENFSSSTQTLRVLWSHELGHNFSSGHDDSGGFIMSPSVNTSTIWSAQSQNSINNFIPTRNCLRECAAAGPPIAFMEVSHEEACTGSYISFFDESEGNVTERFWNFDGGIPATSTDPHPIVFFPNPGQFSVSLSVENGQGNDFTSFTVFVEQDDAYPKVLYYENFEEGFSGWDVENPDNNIGWELISTGGNFGSRSAYVNNYDYDAAGQTDALVSPFFDLSNQAEVRFSFEYAYVRYNNNLRDQLRVSLSTNGGNTFPNILFEGDETGSGNFATGGDLNSVFIPTSAADWCDAGPGCIDLDLSAYDGESDVVIKIENITGFGNNMFIDNIALTATCAAAVPPIANFSQDEVIGCAPLVVGFYDQSEGIIDFMEWEFPGGDPDYSTHPSPVIEYTIPGTYDVTIFVENGAGSDVFTELEAVTVLEPAVADFTYTNMGRDYTFTSISTGDIDTYEWVFGDGEVSTDPNPVHTYASAGTYLVELRVYNDCGSDLFFETVVIEALLTADFTADVTQGCAPLNVQFMDTSSGSPDSWDWSFPGASPSSSDQENPSVTYFTPGIFDVSLTVTEGTATETITIQDYIEVLGPPQAAFTASIAAGDDSPTINNNSINADTYFWDFGNDETSTLPNPTVTYTQAGEYTITLTASNACGIDVATQTITVVFTVDPSFTVSQSSGCAPFTTTFTAMPQGAGLSYDWDFPGGNPSSSTSANPTVTYNTAGQYNVTLDITNAAGTTTTTENNYITVNALPIAGFTATATPGSLTVTIDDTSSGGDATDWDFGDTNMAAGNQTSHTYAAAGTYTITQTVQNECGSDMATQTVTVVLPPDVSFTSSATNGCTPLSVSFTASPQEAGNTYSWIFAGGSPSTSSDPNPTVVYNTVGSFDVSLTVTNAAGPVTTTQTDYINVNTAPTAGFMATTTAGSLTVSLMDQSNGANTISWDYGDTNTAAGTQTSYTYAAAGTYTITQTVQNECGTDMATQTVTVILPPDVSFTSSTTSGCTPLSVNFTASPQEPGNTYSWVFAGGSPSTSSDPNPTVVYNTVGSFDVSLTITNAAGPVTTTQTDYINVNTAPTAGFTATATPGSLTVSLMDQSSGASAISWDFGDTNTATGTQTSYTYAAAGTYTITQTVQNECGSDMATQTVTVVLPPDVSFTSSATNGCAPLSVNFTASPQAAGNTYSWTFAGGSPSTSSDPNPTVVYNTVGSFDVSLTVTNAAGPVTTTQTDYINVNTAPTAGFTAIATPGSLTVNLMDQSNGANTISWDFGDTNTATGNQTSYTYAAAGTYTITQTVQNECGTDMATQTVTLILPPDASFTSTTTNGCPPLTVDFTASPQEAGNTYSWTFAGGTPSSSTDPNPTVVYNTAGSFDVSLTITNAAGSGTVTQTDYISVGLGPVANFTSSNTFGSGLVNFTSTSNGANTYSWDFGDDNGSDLPNPNHTYTTAGTYLVTLTVSNECGSDIHTEMVTIVFPPSAAFTNTVTSGCAPHSVTYTAADQSAGNTFAWTFDGGTPASSTAAMPTVTYNTAGTYAVELTVTNAAGTVTEAIADYVNISTVPNTGFLLDSELGSLTIEVDGPTNDGTNEWLWDFGDDTQTTGTSAIHTYAASGTYTVTLMATNACGTTTSQQMVTVLIAPEATFTASSLQICPGETIALSADATGDVSYAWSTPGGIPTEGTNQIHMVSFPNPGTYAIGLTVSNAAGSNSSQQFVEVLAQPSAGFTFITNGLTVITENTSINATNYSWSYPGGTSIEVSPEITFAGVGTYEIILTASNACGEDSFSQMVTIEGSVPAVSFTAENTEGCGPLSVSFTSMIDNADTFEWSFAGGTPATSTDPNPVVVYDTPGTYPVTLTATNAFGGNSVTQDALVTVFTLVTAEFGFFLDGTTANFFHSTIGANSILWTFPDGSTSSMDEPAYTFPGNGTYTVSLEAVGPCNTVVIDQAIIIDGPLPEIDIANTALKGCAPFDITFTDNSAQEPTAWAWEFPGGNPATSNESSATVEYTTAGIYAVSLTVTNIYGTTTQDWAGLVEIIDVPAEPNYTLEILNENSVAFEVVDPVLSWIYSWDFDDTNTAEGTLVEHTYTESGDYTVTLTATNDCGSTSSSGEVNVIIVGVNTPEWASNLWLAPNPTQGQVLLNAENWPGTGQLNVQLTNALGQHLQRSSLTTHQGNWQQGFDLSQLPAGTYWLQLQWGTEVWTQKVVKI